MNGNKPHLMSGAAMPPGIGQPAPTSADALLGMLLGIRAQYAGDPSVGQAKEIIKQIDDRVLTIINGIQLQKAPTNG